MARVQEELEELEEPGVQVQDSGTLRWISGEPPVQCQPCFLEHLQCALERRCTWTVWRRRRRR